LVSSLNMNIRLYRCFKSDRRISMEVYADTLKDCLETFDYQIDEFIPSSPLERFSKSQLVMRFLRYQHYNSVVKKQQFSDVDIHHVTDHGYAHLLPALGAGKHVVSAHDIIPFLTWKNRLGSADLAGVKSRKPALNIYSLNFLNRFDRIITISQSTANDLAHYFNVPETKISVIPPVLDNKFRLRDSQEIDGFRKKYGLSKSSKWVMLSGREYYKNHRTALKVFKEVKRQVDFDITLVKSGLPSPEFEADVKTFDLEDSVKYLYLTDHDELPLLYGAVDVLFFPSLYEGFGMPVAEALACGTPVVSSNRASLPEAGGKVSIQCDVDDDNGFVVALVKSLSCYGMIEKLRDEGPKWTRQFRAEPLGIRLKELYGQLLAAA